MWLEIIRWNLVDGVQNVSRGWAKRGYMSALGVRLSKAGSMISLVCAVHCALTPLALLALPLLAAQYGGALEGIFGVVFSHSFEWVFLGVIVVVAGFGVLATYPVHSDRRPAMLTVLGFFILLSVRLFIKPDTSLEISGDLIGASIIAWGGFLNRLLCHCHSCHNKDEENDVFVDTGEPRSVPASTP